MRNKIIVVLLVGLLLGLAGCQKTPDNQHKNDTGNKDEEQQQGEDIDTKNLLPVAVFTMDDGQTFEVELYREVAPVTVENFIRLVQSGFYDGTLIHRITNAVIQGGGHFLDKDNNKYYKQEKNIVGEFSANGYVNNLSHDAGVISMARASDFNSASSQFFICYENCSYYDGDYAAFGRVRSGLDVVKSISNSQVIEDAPIDNIIIKKVKLKYVQYR